MTNLFERQNIAKRKTQILLLYFLPALAATIGAIYLFFQLVFFTHASHFNAQLFFAVCEVSLIIILGGSLVKIWSLQGGGGAIATMLGGRAVPLQPTDLDEKKFRDVVEEMSIASGVPVPQLFVLPRETSINAFAAGHSTSDAAIVVTKGALKLLDRDELQGVVAHEFSHICNGDMSLNLWLIGVVHGILCIALLGKFLVRLACDGDLDRVTAIAFVVGGALFICGIIGYFFGSLIKCAVSRQREYLADAAAVQFTRNPLGLAGALKKIGGLNEHSEIVAANADEVSHLFFADANTSWLFGTHPPLTERIKLLDPSFDGRFTKVTPLVSDVPVAPPLIVHRPAPAPTFIRRHAPQNLVYAASLTASFTPELDSIAREPFSACALMYAILLDSNDTARSKQLTDVVDCADKTLVNTALQYLPTVNALSKGQKLALVSIAMPALRQMSTAQFDSFSKTTKALIESDSEISLFEYSVQKSLVRHLEPRFNPSKPPIAQYYAAAGLAAECAVLLSALAYESSADNQEIAKAFQWGADDLELPDNKPISLLPKDACNLPQIDAAIQKISQAALPVKRQILNACSLVVASDSLVKEDEAEMLHAIADAVGCPLPPFVSSIAVPEAA